MLAKISYSPLDFKRRFFMKPITIKITLSSIRNFSISRNIRHFDMSEDVMFIAADASTTYRIAQQHKNDCGAFGYSEMVVKRYEHNIDTVYDCVVEEDCNVCISGKETLSNFGFMHLFTSLYDTEHVTPRPDSMFLAANNQQQ